MKNPFLWPLPQLFVTGQFLCALWLSYTHNGQPIGNYDFHGAFIGVFVFLAFLALGGFYHRK